MYYKACINTFPVLLYTTKLAQTRSSTTVYYKACTNTFQYKCVLQRLHKHVPVRGFAAYPIDTVTPEDKQRWRFCSFPQRHGDARTRFCNFPHRHRDVCAAKRTRFCSFPIDTELTTRKTTRKRAWKRARKTSRRPTGGEQGSSPQTPTL